MLDKALSYNAARKEANLEGLKDFLRIPSVSTLKQHKPDIARAANFVVDQLRSMGFNAVDLIPGTESENPLIKGEWLGAPGKQTVSSVRSLRRSTGRSAQLVDFTSFRTDCSRR